MRFGAPLILAFALGACAAPAPPASTEPPPPRSALARAALAEWEAWGRIVIEGWPEARPADTALTSARFARLLDYWAAVPGGRQTGQRLQELRDGAVLAGEEPPGGTPWWEDASAYERPAWSAAFISATARRAGLPERDLPSSSRHASYIDAVLRRAAEEGEEAPFRPHAPEERAPRPGDLLCGDRSFVPLAHWSGRLAESGRPRAMHCDVVVRTGGGVVEAVGGNLQGMVALRRLPSDAEGRVLPAPPGRAPFVLILAAREEP